MLQIHNTDCFYFNNSTCKNNIHDVAKKRQINNLQIKAQRGSIYDRHGDVLAMSLPVKTLCVNAYNVHNSGEYNKYQKLLKIINLNEKKFINIINKNKNKKEYYLMRQIDMNTYNSITKLQLPNIYFINESKRVYLGGEAFSNILGFTGIDDNGQEGLEYSKNEFLSPKHGLKKVKQDNLGRTIETIQIHKQPKPGKDLYLTIDKRLQIVGYEVLRKYINKFSADSGSLILINSTNGEILSMINYPSFDPTKRIQFKGLKIKNRAVYDLIEPGSTVKPMIIYSGLDNKVIDESSLIKTAPGVIKIENKEIRDWKYLGDLYPREIIKYSSNIAAAKVSKKIPKKQVLSTLNNFGMGQSLFIDLPGAKIGNLPVSNEMSESKHLSIGYGYGLSTSLLHLVHAYSIFANQGKRIQLSYVYSSIKDDYKKEKILDKGLSIKVLNMMKDVVHSNDGTGKKAKVHGYTVYGKTGTVRQIINNEYSKSRHNALFVGITGNPEPNYVAGVIIRNPKDKEGSGGSHAAPVFGEFMQHTLRLLKDNKYANSR